MSRKISYAVMVAFGAAHLVITSIYIWSDAVAEHPASIGRCLSIYMNYTGSNNDYTYFAPSVADATRMICVVKDSSGLVQLYKVGTSDRAAKLNFDCLLASCMYKREGLDLFSQSFAAFYLSCHPHASRVTIISQVYVLPAINEYHKGAKPFWKTFYTGTFKSKISKS